MEPIEFAVAEADTKVVVSPRYATLEEAVAHQKDYPGVTTVIQLRGAERL